MQIETFRELLAEVGPLVPFQAITEFDEGPSWVLVVDDETFLLLDWLESTRRVVLHADIGQLPGAGRTAMLGRLLHYNTTNSSIVTGTQAAVRSFATKEHVAHVDEEFAAIANAVDEYTKERGKAEREARLSRKRSGTPIAQKGPLAPVQRHSRQGHAQGWDR